MRQPVNLSEKLALVSELWSPKVIAEMNDYQFKLAKVRGEFIWHSHQNTDEVFIVLKGSLTIYFRDREVHLTEGELFVVPKGLEHKPFSKEECHILLVEPRGVKNTGDIKSPFTSNNDIWI